MYLGFLGPTVPSKSVSITVAPLGGTLFLSVGRGVRLFFSSSVLRYGEAGLSVSSSGSQSWGFASAVPLFGFVGGPFRGGVSGYSVSDDFSFSAVSSYGSSFLLFSGGCSFVKGPRPARVSSLSSASFPRSKRLVDTVAFPPLRLC